MLVKYIYNGNVFLMMKNPAGVNIPLPLPGENVNLGNGSDLSADFVVKDRRWKFTVESKSNHQTTVEIYLESWWEANNG